MRVLITGKNGQVGSSLVSELSKTPSIDFLALGRDELDITNSEQVNEVIKKYQPTVIINAAAYTAVDKAESEVELANAINNIGPKNLARAASNINAVILHISTDYVFAGNKDGLYAETDEVNPQGVYGQTKLAGEQSVAQECAEHIILRTAWVFSEYGNNFVKTMLCLAKTSNTLNVVGDQFGAPTYAGDIAKVLIKIAQQIEQGSSKFGIYNYSGYPYVSWFEFAESILDAAADQEIINKKPSISSIGSDQYPTPAKRPYNSRLSIEKINKAFSVEASNWALALKNIQKYIG